MELIKGYMKYLILKKIEKGDEHMLLNNGTERQSMENSSVQNPLTFMLYSS